MTIKLKLGSTKVVPGFSIRIRGTYIYGHDPEHNMQVFVARMNHQKKEIKMKVRDTYHVRNVEKYSKLIKYKFVRMN